MGIYFSQYGEYRHERRKMNPQQTVSVILASTVIATIISVIVSSLVAIRLKNLDYKNEYYKKILDKRLEAYKYLETQISVLKLSVVGSDRRPYYSIFSHGEQKFYEFQLNLHAAIATGMWMNDKTSNLMDRFNDLFFKISNEISSPSNEELIEVGKKYYDEIGTMRAQLENSVREDLMTLHNFRALRKKSKIKSGYRVFRDNDRVN